MAKNEELVVPVHPIKGLFGVGAHKYTGALSGVCYLKEVEYLNGIVSCLSRRYELDLAMPLLLIAAQLRHDFDAILPRLSCGKSQCETRVAHELLLGDSVMCCDLLRL